MPLGGVTGEVDAAGPSMRYSERFPVEQGSAFDAHFDESIWLGVIVGPVGEPAKKVIGTLSPLDAMPCTVVAAPNETVCPMFVADAGLLFTKYPNCSGDGFVFAIYSDA